MEKPDLLKKIDAMMDVVRRNGEWGSIEIEFQNGTAVRIRKSTTEKLFNAENNRARYDR
jgi:hypothetical protein